jgi:hypothetical protein
MNEITKLGQKNLRMVLLEDCGFAGKIFHLSCLYSLVEFRIYSDGQWI